MGKAYTLPITRSGRSSIIPEGPYHYGVSYIAVHARADVDKLSKIHPKFLKPTGDVWIYVAEFVTVHGDNLDHLYKIPEMTQYMEAAIATRVIFDGRSYLYFPFMWVDKDWALIRGWLNGYPKKIADISMTRINNLNPAIKARKDEIKYGGYCSRFGRRLITVTVDVKDRDGSIPIREWGPTLTLRYIPGITEGTEPIVEALMIKRTNSSLGEVFNGLGEVEIGGGENDEVDFVDILDIVSGYVYSSGFTIEGSILIKRLRIDDL